MPNLVLINVGLNDCGGNVEINDAGARMKDLIDYLFQTVPGTTVILSTLVPNWVPAIDACLVKVNDQYRKLASSYQGQRFTIADMYDFVGLDGVWQEGTPTLGHPTDEGFSTMAAVWWNAFQRLGEGLQAPDNSISDNTGDTTCAKTYGTGRGPVQTQGGSGHDDGPYKHNSSCVQSLWQEPALDPPNLTFPSETYFAQLINYGVDRADATDELIHAYVADGGGWVYKYAENQVSTPNGFGPWVEFNPGTCPTYSRIAFGDLNNDGLADFFCIGPSAEVSVALNLGGNPPKWDSLHEIMDTQLGYTFENVRIAEYVHTQNNASLTMVLGLLITSLTSFKLVSTAMVVQIIVWLIVMIRLLNAGGMGVLGSMSITGKVFLNRVAEE